MEMEMAEGGVYCALRQALSGSDMQAPFLDSMLKPTAAAWQYS